MTFIEYMGSLEELDKTPYWHLASPDGVGFFYNNLYFGKGIMHSVSYMIEIDPRLSGACTPYSIMNKEQDKEAVFEKIRADSYRHLPTRQKAIFVLKNESDANRVINEWFKSEHRNIHEARILAHSITHVGDSNWLNHSDWDYAAQQYWAGEITDNPLIEVIVHGTLYFPEWEKFAKPIST